MPVPTAARKLSILASAACLALSPGAAQALGVYAGADLFLGTPGVATLMGEVTGRAPVAFRSGDGNGPTENAFVYYNSQTGTQWSPEATIQGQGVMGWPGDFVDIGGEVYGMAILNQQLFRVMDFATATLEAIGPVNPNGPHPRVGSLAYLASADILFGVDYYHNRLLEIDRTDGSMGALWNFAIQNGLQDVRGLAAYDDLLYVYDAVYDQVFSFDLVTCVLSPLALVDTAVSGADAGVKPWFDEIAFHDGELYGMLHYRMEGLFNQQLRHIDLTTGTTRDIGPEWVDQSLHALLIESMPEEVLWTVVSGPGPVSFSDDTSPQTLAEFHTGGVYTLQLTVFGDEGPISDQMTVTVPESTTAVQLLVGLAGLAWVGRRRNTA